MEDDSLDDFFAKKDKGKKKSKAKLSPGDLLPETEGEQKAVKSDKKKKKKKDKEKQPQNAASAKSSGTSDVKEDEDWKDFEQESEKDYSGLRIHNLQISKEEEEEAKEDEGDNEIGENGEKREGNQGPWNKINNPQPVVQHQPPPPPAQSEPEKPKEDKPVGKYVPPSRRGAGASEATSTVHYPSHLRKKKIAPNLTSEEDFPTLGGNPAYPGGDQPDLSTFHQVRTGNRQDTTTAEAPQLQLGNKFDALSQGDAE